MLSSYTLLDGTVIGLTSLTHREAILFDAASVAYSHSPKWSEWNRVQLAAAVEYYDRLKVPRSETIRKPLYRIIQDMGSRLMVSQGVASNTAPDAVVLGDASPPGDWKWFITPTVVKQLLAIGDIPHSESSYQMGLEFLGRQSLEAREIADDMKTGLMLMYRTNGKVEIGSKKTRLEFTVAVPLKHGDLPQLVNVRDKGKGSRRDKR